MRVVLDTNTLVSACWTPEGLEARVVELATSGKIIPCLTTEIRAEYTDVLSRPKLASIGDKAAGMLAALEAVATLVASEKKVAVSEDDDDNRFLECAEAAGADYLITGNLKHYPSVWETTEIVNARAFLAKVGM